MRSTTHLATTAISPRALRVGFTVIRTSCPGAVRNHQPADREVAGAVAHQRRAMRLLDAEHLTRLALRQPARLDDLVDVQCEPRLEQFLLRVRQAEVGEHVAAALLD